MDNQRARKEAARLGFRVAELREERGVTQEQLAELVELSTRQIQRIEAGESNPAFVSLVALAAALRCQTAELFARPKSLRRRRPGRSGGT